MKKIVYVFAASLAMIACQNEDLVTENSSVENAKIELVQVTDNGQIVPVGNLARTANPDASYALKFDSQETYDATIKQLESLSDKDKLAFAESYGLQSLQQMAVEADAELEQIGAEATSEADFREKYEAYRAKYADALISNPYDDSDLSLYVPDGDNLSTYLMDNKCMVVIGGVVEKKLLKDDISNSDKACFTSQQLFSGETRALGYNEKWYLNEFSESGYVSSKKLTFRIEIADPGEGSIRLHIGAQKHMWYGWKRDDSREFYYTPKLSNIIYQAVVNNHLITVPQAERYCHKGGKLEVIIGKKNIVTNRLTGTILVWSDCIAEKDANGNFLYENKKVLVGSGLATVSVPKCLDSNAFHVNVNL